MKDRLLRSFSGFVGAAVKQFTISEGINQLRSSNY
jgi:hypothetical protein